LDTETAEKLIETDPTELPPPKLKPGNDLAGRIIKYMLTKNYYVSTKPGEYNIVYVEGMNADGIENNDVRNQFNDRRILLRLLMVYQRLLVTGKQPQNPEIFILTIP
jgi:hypothetical protein